MSLFDMFLLENIYKTLDKEYIENIYALFDTFFYKAQIISK